MRFFFKDFRGEKMLWLVWRLELECHRDESIVSTVASQTTCKLPSGRSRSYEEAEKLMWGERGKESRVRGKQRRSCERRRSCCLNFLAACPFLFPWSPFLLWVLSCVLTVNPLELEQVSVASSQEKFYLQGHFQLIKDLRIMPPCNLELKKLLEVDQNLWIK